MIEVGERVVLRKTAETIFKLGYGNMDEDTGDGDSTQRGTILDITDSPFSSHKLYQIQFDNGQRLWIMDEHITIDELHRRKTRIEKILSKGEEGQTKEDK